MKSQEAVDKLYQLRDHYYDSIPESLEDDQKWMLVRKQMMETVELLNKSKDAAEGPLEEICP